MLLVIFCGGKRLSPNPQTILFVLTVDLYKIVIVSVLVSVSELPSIGGFAHQGKPYPVAMATLV